MSLRASFIGGAAFAAAVAAVLWMAAFGHEAAPERSVAPSAVTVTPAARAFAPSLEGTRPDGAIRVAPDDGIVVDAQLIALFEYYLSTVGERSPSEVQIGIERELDRTLRPAAADAAKRVLARYLAYKRALATLEAGPELAGPDAASLVRRLDALARMRSQFFTKAEIAAIFGQEDAANADALARLRISEDDSLTAQQRQERLAALDASLPAELREEREAPLKIARMQQETERMRAAGAAEDEIFRVRAQAFGADAAGRLAEVDREEAAWRQRIGTYLAQRKGLNDEAARALRSRMFSEEEQRRLPVYESGQM
ncbi:MAG: lipase secretion chaperone [Pseudomonadota bacterium]